MGFGKVGLRVGSRDTELLPRNSEICSVLSILYLLTEGFNFQFPLIFLAIKGFE